MSTNELTAKVKELKSLMALIEEAQAEAEAIKDQIKLAMGDTEELRVGDYKVRFAKVASTRFDSAAFKKTHGDLYEQYTKQTTTRRFSLA